MIKNFIKHIELTSNNMFDIVIPVGPNDNDIIYKQIESTKKILLDTGIFT